MPAFNILSIDSNTLQLLTEWSTEVKISTCSGISRTCGPRGEIIMNRNEIVVLQKMKSELTSKIKELQHKLDLISQLLKGNPVIENAEVPIPSTTARTPTPPTPKKTTTSKRKRTVSSNSIISRIQIIIQDNPDLEFSTSELTTELKAHWKEDYATKDNLLSVISAIMTARDTVKAGWFTKTKKAGKWYFKAATPAPIKKTA